MGFYNFASRSGSKMAEVVIPIQTMGFYNP